MSANELSLVEKVARELVNRDGAGALRLARDRAELDEKLGGLRSATVWRYIADEIEYLQAGPATRDAE